MCFSAHVDDESARYNSVLANETSERVVKRRQDASTT